MNIRKLAKEITVVENANAQSDIILDHAWRHQTGTYRIGITGPPGAGKSTLVNGLAAHFTALGLQVAIIMVDPSSPFSGGAILGDRIRVNSLSADPNIFIRSMATRGSLGGLSTRTHDVCDLLDSYGFDIVIIETVGVGQIELDIAETADVTVTVFVPESGDDIQAMKAGLMEITDIFVVNKADRDGVKAMMINLQSLLSVKRLTSEQHWDSPVLQTIASKGEGITELGDSIMAYRSYLEKEENWEKLRIERKKKRTIQYIEEELISLMDSLTGEIDQFLLSETSPKEISRKLIRMLKVLENKK